MTAQTEIEKLFNKIGEIELPIEACRIVDELKYQFHKLEAQIKPNYQKKVWDRYTEARIKKLNPTLQPIARGFINRAEEQGMFVRITSGLRTFAEQDRLYAQGRTTPGKIVTNVKGGSSFHNYGLAFDVVEVKNKKGLWENPNWSKLGKIGKDLGLEWGGDWVRFVDRPHFQLTHGYTTKQLHKMYVEGNMKINDLLK